MLRDNKLHHVVFCCSHQKAGKLQQGTIGFLLLRSAVSGARGTPPADYKGHSLSLCETSSEVVGQVGYPPNPGETCCNSVSLLDNSVALLLFGRSCLKGQNKPVSKDVITTWISSVLASFPHLSLLLICFLSLLMSTFVTIPKYFFCNSLT